MRGLPAASLTGIFAIRLCTVSQRDNSSASVLKADTRGSTDEQCHTKASPRSEANIDRKLAVVTAVEVKILTGFALAMGLLLFAGGYTYRTSVEFTNSVEWIAHTQEVRATLAGVYGSLAGADLAQRGYLLPSDPAQWDEYLRLADVAKDHLGDLTRLVSDNPAQLENLATLKSVVAAR